MTNGTILTDELAENRVVSAADGSSAAAPQLAPNTNALTLAALVHEIRQLRKDCESVAHWWQSSLVPALITTLGAAVIATGWTMYSHRVDLKIADNHRNYDQKAALKQTLDSSFEGQVSALETVCTRDTVGSFQELKRKWVLEPEKDHLLATKAKAKANPAVLARIDDDIADTARIEDATDATLATAYEKTVSARPVSSTAAEFRIVFDTEQTRTRAEAFMRAWKSLDQETSAEAIEGWKQQLRAAVKVLNQAAHDFPNARGETLAVEGSEFAKIQQRREHACRSKADALRAAYEDLSNASASELRRLRLL